MKDEPTLKPLPPEFWEDFFRLGKILHKMDALNRRFRHGEAEILNREALEIYHRLLRYTPSSNRFKIFMGR